MEKNKMLLLIFLVISVTVIIWLFPRKVKVFTSKCIYHYLYFDNNGHICKDEKELLLCDANTIKKILETNWYFWEFDDTKGFSEDYCLKFESEKMKSITFFIKFGSPLGIIGLNGQNYTCELNNKERDQLYTILKKYHENKRALIAG